MENQYILKTVSISLSCRLKWSCLCFMCELLGHISCSLFPNLPTPQLSSLDSSSPDWVVRCRTSSSITGRLITSSHVCHTFSVLKIINQTLFRRRFQMIPPA